MVHPSKPNEIPQKLLTERGLQPCKVFVLWSPSPGLTLVVSVMAQHVPCLLPVAQLDATAHEVAPFGGKGQMLALFDCGGLAKGAVSLIHHG
jgi:hypothetical protein